MKLQLIENTPHPRRQSDLCAIKINKYGQVILTAQACKHMGLEAGHTIGILQDEEHPDDFYLLPGSSKQRNLPILRDAKRKNSTQLITNYSASVRKITEQFSLEPKTHTIPVGGAIKTQGGTVFALITKALKKEVSNG